MSNRDSNFNQSSRGRGGFRGGRGGGRGGGAGPRPKGKEDRTTFLPKALMAEMEGSDGRKAGGFERPGRPLGRKEERKLGREEKRANKGPSAAQAPARPPPSAVKAHRPAPPPPPPPLPSPPAVTSSSVSASSKKRKLAEPEPVARPSKKLPASTPLSRLLDSSAGPSSSNPRPKKLKGKLSSTESVEEREIAWLEYKLGRGKKGKKAPPSKGKSDQDDGDESDGLDELLDDLDRLEAEALGMDSESEGSGDEEEEADEMDEDASLGSGPEEEGLEEFETWGGIQAEDREPSLSPPPADPSSFRKIAFALPSDEDAIDVESAQASPLVEPSNDAAPARYVPPALRARLAAAEQAAGGHASKKEEMARLEKAGTGLLNRMGEANIEGIINEVEALYRKHSRHDVTTTLTNLILDTISSRANLLDSFVVLYATLVAGLYKIVGVEFGASFTQTLVQSLMRHLEPSTASDEANKAATNLTTLLAELYNFQVISCLLIYDLVRRFLENGLREEREVELLLKIVRSSGPQLRSDDPTALKDIIQVVQQKTSELDAAHTTSRTKFMIETLTNLKNNRVKSGHGGDGAADATVRMKKFLGGLEKKKTVLTHEPLRISLSDLLTADSKGKWWLVGAGWSGNPLVDNQAQLASVGAASKAQVAAATPIEEDELMVLARKQGMNTDVRRRVFVVVMSSTDYVDAQDRLSQLGLTDVQQREVVRVLLHCSGNEKLYNPFYTLVLSRLLDLHTHRFTVQYSLWDFLRELGEGDVGGADVVRAFKESGGSFGKNRVPERQVKNLARTYAWCVAKEGITLAVLKPVNFTSLRPATVRFLSLFLSSLILSTQTASPLLVLPDAEPERAPLEAVAMKIGSLPGLAEGIVYFLTTSMAARGKEGDWDKGMGARDREVVVWGMDVLKETLMMGLDGRGIEED